VAVLVGLVISWSLSASSASAQEPAAALTLPPAADLSLQGTGELGWWDEWPTDPDEDRDAPREPAMRRTLGRFALEALGGIGGCVVGGIGGALLGYMYDPGKYGSMGGAMGAILGGLTGIAVGGTYGAYWTGNALGGDGGWGWTLLGNLGGFVLGGLVAGAVGNPAIGITMLVLGVGAGSVVGYELGSDR
jgi:hypothetical protein